MTRPYIVTDANGVESRWNLDEETAKRLDAKPVERAQDLPPPGELAEQQEEAKPKARRAPNKARTARNK